MKKSSLTLLIIIGSIIVAVGGLIWVVQRSQNGAPGQYDKLAECLTAKGVKFYGAYWCPHCAEQKRILGDSMKKIDYVECALPGGQNGQTQICQDMKIESYPTWIFADGTRKTGVQEPSDLAAQAGCSLDSATGTKP